MNKDFVSFNLAKKLKEKGFPQEKDWTIAMYDEDENWYSLITTSYYIEYIFEDFDDNDFACPTISQVLKWLREEKKIFVVIHPTGHVVQYYYTVHNLARSFDTFEYTQSFATYEQAAIEGIEYCLDNLI